MICSLCPTITLNLIGITKPLSNISLASNISYFQVFIEVEKHKMIRFRFEFSESWV